MNKRFDNVMGIVMSPLVVAVVFIAIACVIGYTTESAIMNNYEMDLLRSKVVATQSTMETQHRNMSNIANMMSDHYSALYKAWSSDDMDAVKSEMKWTCRTASLNGYILTDLDGTIKSTSYPDVMSSDVKEIVFNTKDKGQVSGCGDFLDNEICEYMSTIVRDENGEDMAIAILVAYRAGDTEALAQSKKQNDIEIYVFAGSKCISSTIEGAELRKIEITSEAMDTCFINHTTWMGKADILGEEQYVACTPFIDFNGVTKGVMMIQVSRDVHDLVMLTIVLFLIAAGAGVTILFVSLYVRIKKRLANTIKRLVKEVGVIATGDLTQEIEEPEYCEEIKILANGVKEMQRKIKEVVEPVVEMSDSIVGSIHQLTSASGNMSNSANRQAASLEEISSSMEQMGANIQQNTDNSIETNSLAEEINSQVNEMGKAASNSYDAIRNIANDVTAINELVMQTNILALNASVEAARAGEQGRGFAIVAKEVGRLADQTHETADGINETATSSIAEAENAYNLINILLPKIEKVAQLIKEITAASVEQNAGVNQVNSAILELNSVTQENAAGAEEIAASAQELQRMLHDVTNAIKIFKV